MDRRAFLSKILPKGSAEFSLRSTEFSEKSLNDNLEQNSENSENSEQKIQKIQINTHKCLAWNGIICSSCADVCHARAIEFLGLYRPIINEKCDNCNDCLTSCFKGAINVC